AAYFYFDDHKVANTIAKTVVENYITLPVILSGLIAAISWNLLTWYYGIPSSSSHTLIGGFAGAGIAKAISVGDTAMHAINLAPVIKTVPFTFLAQVMGMIIYIIITISIITLPRWSKPATAEKWFKTLQLISTAALSLAQ